MIVLGLTGSIGMGKSTAARMLKKLGCAVHDSDMAVRKALTSKGQAFEEVAVTFPECWDKKKHMINRGKLAKIVFDDFSKKQKLEEILHPIVRQSQSDFIRHQKRAGRKIVVLDIPLLFETGAEKRVDYTLVVTAPYDIQRRRVLARAGMTEKKFHDILDTQMPDKEKCARADFIIPTGLGLSYTFRILKNVLQEAEYA